MSFPVRAEPYLTQIAAAGSRRLAAATTKWTALKDRAAANASPSGITPSNIMSPAPEPTRGSRTEVSLGARAHNTHPANPAHAPPTNRSSTPTTRTPRLTPGPCVVHPGSWRVDLSG
jgi:hypothetical protein